METDTEPRVPTTARQTLVSVLLGSAVVLTAVQGLLVGWLAINFQIASYPDADDYAVGAGAYGAATVVLLLGALALHSRATAPWQLPGTLVLAVVLGMLTVSAVADATSSTPGAGISHWWDGSGGVLVGPWTWWLVVMGMTSLGRRAPVSG